MLTPPLQQKEFTSSSVFPKRTLENLSPLVVIFIFDLSVVYMTLILCAIFYVVIHTHN